EIAAAFAGDTSWTNYSVQARVKATSFASTTGVVSLAARAAGATKMYRLSLTGGNKVQLPTMHGSAARRQQGPARRHDRLRRHRPRLPVADDLDQHLLHAEAHGQRHHDQRLDQ